MRYEDFSKQNQKPKNNYARNYKHGMKGTRLYNIWVNMHQRCNNKNIPTYRNYGARGIRVCKEWDDFNTFLKWAVNKGYKDDLTIERNDVNGDYEPSNCSWITKTEQSQNKRTNVLLTYKGETKNMKQWSDELGIDYYFLRDRLRRGWSVKEAIEIPKGVRR